MDTDEEDVTSGDVIVKTNGAKNNLFTYVLDKRKGTVMETNPNDADVIILSDDDDPENGIPCSDSSIYIVEGEDLKEPDFVLTPITLEEDLVVTFSRPAEVMPHARYDCPIHPFTATEASTDAPLAGNQLICDQCFCYICDKLASSCPVWGQTGVCHCNSHKKSNFWSNLRNSTLLGGLQNFKLTLAEIDPDLREAEKMLQVFREDILVQFSTFLKGKPEAGCGQSAQSRQQLIHDYTPVYERVIAFLNKAEEQSARAAAILRLGAAEVFMQHMQVPGSHSSCLLQSAMADVNAAKKSLLQRVILLLQRQLVFAEFTLEFRQKIQDFYARLLFPVELRNFKNSLCVRPWTDILLVTVLKGQNISGIRKEGKKKDVLTEQMSVIMLRSELLQWQKRYRELCRYLRVVHSTEPAISLQALCDLVPYFLCLDGDFSSALISLLPLVNSPASRFTPQLFIIYFCIFKTVMAPKVVAVHPSQLYHSDAPWEPIKGAVPMKRDTLVKFALRVHKCCPAVYADSQCWTRLLELVSTLEDSVTPVPPPSPKFLHEARSVVNLILLENPVNVQIPRFFLEVYPDQALLLLVTRALGWRIVSSPLRPVLPVLSTFQENFWALEWVWADLQFSAGQLNSFRHSVTQEIQNAKVATCAHCTAFLETGASLPPSSGRNTDYTKRWTFFADSLFPFAHSAPEKLPVIPTRLLQKSYML